MTQAAADPKTRTLEAPGAKITHDIRESEGETNARTLVLIGSPMDASGEETSRGRELRVGRSARAVGPG